MNKIFSFLFILLSILAKSQNQVPLLKSDSFAITLAKENADKIKLTGDLKEESRYYDQIAFIYWEHNYYQVAADWYLKSLALNEKLSNQSGVSMINSNLGMIYTDLKEYNKSLEYFQKTLNYRKMIKDKVGIISTQINMSVVFNNLKQFEQSVISLNDALTIAREMNDMDQMKSCYGMLSETYEKAKQPDKAQYYFELYRTFHEKIQGDKDVKNEKIIEETQLQLKLTESEKINKELELKLKNKELQDKELELVNADSAKLKLYRNLTKAELQNELLIRDNEIKNNLIQLEQDKFKRQRFQLFFLIVIVALFLLLIAVLIKAFINKKKVNKLLITQKEEIACQRDYLNKAFEQLRKLKEFKEGMSLMIAHDIKNPLNAILNPSKIHSSAKQMEIARGAGKQILNLLMNFLDIQKNEVNEFKLNRNDHSLYNIAYKAVEQVLFLADNKFITIQNNISKLDNGNFDNDIIERIFINILTNAVKYANVNSIIEINCKLDDNESKYCISISNNGEYIPEEFIPYVFDQFSQDNEKKSGSIKSSGLGLAFCKMAIEAHKGKIWVTSRSNEKTTFLFTLDKSIDIANLPSVNLPLSMKENITFVLTQEEKDILKGLIMKLDTLEVYEVSSIRKLLKTINDNESKSLQHWKESLLNIVDACNEAEFRKFLTSTND